jgi:nicotinate-nucleotide adenylyltransferase
MRIALFGGSFNPPHLSHEAVVKLLLDDPAWAEVWIVPTHRHPYGKPLANFEDRIAMCRLAFVPLGGRVKVLDVERDLGGVSYTVHTVEALKRLNPSADFGLVVGSDVLSERGQWKDFERLLSLVDFVIVPRDNYPADDRRMLETEPLPDISSSEIRRRVELGQSIEGLVSQAVAAHIHERGLYDVQPSPSRPAGGTPGR